MPKKSILYLQPTFDIDLPRNIRSNNIINTLKEDFEIEVLCFSNSNTAPKSINGVTIHHLEYSFLSKYVFNKTFSGYTPSGLVRFFSRAINFTFGRFLFPDEWILEKNRILRFLKGKGKTYDYVVASMIPFSMGEVAIDLKKRGFTKYIIFDIGDPFGENAATSNETQKKRKIKYERLLIQKSDAIVVTNLATKRYYEALYPMLTANQIKVISQGVNEEIFKASPIKCFDLTKLSIVYAGIFYPALREPNAFFEAVAELNSAKKICVQIYGDTNKFGVDEDKSQIKFLPRIAQTDLAEIYHKSNLILYIDNAFGIQTSGKIYELLMLRIPILMLYSNEQSPILELVSSMKHVFCVKNDVTSIHQALSNLLMQNCLAIKQDFNVSQFTWKSKAIQFADLINTLTSK